MTTRFFSTNNTCWFPVKKPNGRPGSERSLLFEMIDKQPGITATQIEEKWPFPSSMRSRLRELQDQGYVRSERDQDIFGTL